MLVPDDQLTTIVQASFDPSSAAENTFRLVVVSGADEGASIVVDGSRNQTRIGTSVGCELLLHDKLISRRHFSLEWVDGQLKLADLGSRNGTTVDGVRVTGAFLRGGETITLGETQLRLELCPGDVELPVETRVRFGRVVGASLEMRRLYGLCDKLAAADVSVLIEGETGTGKEMLAESIHAQGPRAAGPFMVFDCAAVSPQLIEAELFGHDRGAFTGAVAARKGVFEEAHRGTLLLDEIGDLPIDLQSRLLRALDAGEVKRIGENRWRQVDVRVIAATRRDLDREVQAGRFRDDLFHRLVMTRVELPPLRSRKGDIPILARYFAVQFGSVEVALPASVIARWSEAPWGGNVRELRNAVARYLALGTDAVEEPWSEPLAVQSTSLPHTPGEAADVRSSRIADIVDAAIREGGSFVDVRRGVLQEFERHFLERVLAANGGNVVRAAEASGICRRYFQKLRVRQRQP